MTIKAGKKDRDDQMFDEEFADELKQEDCNSLPSSPASNLSAEHNAAERAPPMVPFQEAMTGIVNEVVNKITPTLQGLIVSDRVIEAQKTAEDWKTMCNLMASSPDIINEKLSLNNGPTKVFRRLNLDMSDPSVVNWQQFLQTPMSQPIWKLMIAFEINQHDPIWDKWWKKIKNDPKDPYIKLCKYLQALMNFHAVSDHFWMQMAINPTCWSAQKIIMFITSMGDWIRSGLVI